MRSSKFSPRSFRLSILIGRSALANLVQSSARVGLKGAFLVAVCFGAMVSGAFTAQAQPEGDVNTDGEFDSADVVAATVRIIGIDPDDFAEQRLLDFDRSGIIESEDSRYLAQVLVGGAAFLPGFSFPDEFLGSNAIVTNQTSVTFRVEIDNVVGSYDVLVDGVIVFSGSGPDATDVVLSNLVEGSTLFSVGFQDAAGTDFTRVITVIRDSIPPAITIESPLQDVVIQDNVVNVSGQAVDGISQVVVQVNGVEMTIEEDGRWSGEVSFGQPGPRELQATAIDVAANQTTVTRTIEIFISAPDTMDVGTARIDLPAGSICRNGEEANIDAETNQAIKAILGPGSDMLMTSMPAGGLTDGVVILPSAMMISVESGVSPEAGLVGAEPEPMFANQPSISLSNDSGADNSVPLWIFQIIPDTDGDGNPEFSLVSRAKVEDTGPNSGRIVPMEPGPFDKFSGTFNPDAPVFDENTIAQVRELPSVQRLMARMEARRFAGQVPKSRVTFLCCAASAIIPVFGNAKCEDFTINDIIGLIGPEEVELELLGPGLSTRAQLMADAENNNETSIKGLFGQFCVPNAATRKKGDPFLNQCVPDIISGNLFKCVGGFFGVPAELNTVLGQVDDARNLVGDTLSAAGVDPALTSDQAATRLSGKLADLGLSILARTEVTEGDFERMDRLIDQQMRLEFIKDKLGQLSLGVDCLKMSADFARVIGNWRFTSGAMIRQDADEAKFDFHFKRFKRLTDCKRMLQAKRDAAIAAERPAYEGRWLRSNAADVATIDPRLVKLQTYMNGAIDLDKRFVALVDDFIGGLDSGLFPTQGDLIPILNEMLTLINDMDAHLVDVGDVMPGVDAIVESQAEITRFRARVESESEILNANLVEAQANAGGLAGAAVTLQGSGSPFVTSSMPGGQFTHYIFTTLTSDPIGTENRMARLEGRPFTATAGAEGGLFAGQRSGNLSTVSFPFTPFSTVDFDVNIGIGDVLLARTFTDDGSSTPTVAITFPPPGFQIPAGFPVRVETNAIDDVGVVGVDISVDGESQIGLPGGLAKGVVQMPTVLGTSEIGAIAIDGAELAAADMVTVNIVDPNGAFIITPDNIRIGQGESVQFAATFLGQPAINAVWKVNGFEGGLGDPAQGAVVGTVSQSGLYDSSSLDLRAVDQPGALAGGGAAEVFQVSVELSDFPGFEAKARVLIIDSRDVVAPAVAFSFPAPAAPGGLLVSQPLAFSFPAPAAPGGLLVSRPFAFSFPAPAAPGGLLSSRPFAIDRQ